jgi:Cys-tRNA(Pro)/Cys-tRNA(Cys) deacylase
MEYKTNVMRILDKMKVEYKSYSYVNTDAISGIDVANILNQNANQVFKTLVTIGKSIEMLKSKDLLDITGYIHGGCSPIGMKKSFTTTIDESATKFETIIFSAGKIGYQVEVSVEQLKKVIRFSLADIV